MKKEDDCADVIIVTVRISVDESEPVTLLRLETIQPSRPSYSP